MVKLDPADVRWVAETSKRRGSWRFSWPETIWERFSQNLFEFRRLCFLKIKMSEQELKTLVCSISNLQDASTCGDLSASALKICFSSYRRILFSYWSTNLKNKFKSICNRHSHDHRCSFERLVTLSCFVHSQLGLKSHVGLRPLQQPLRTRMPQVKQLTFE